ncbi:3-dehydroquinate synthase [Acidocella aminolytica]|jgi:shikimate kinase/3-dehydroquinate synthase|uniref:Multifunctional fusion protein n=1 Tax=Acidocella aminolytica 101 = DSM 11237 TaxID=1120923 RepID=A0A0D6PBT3_9PROT|nr:3-dehydroquinate synthase [Acidocella aminolytica]GAN78821.1 shikimate kinase/3-dehydroquinate synthase [Acidocella aminolytica 101 = DSM 11237]GBQ34892.1 shikimate kinase [Acidocella aminolytica 101 = DSM 11237]SHE86526.1 3-dehydroquinate synthase [Acidocella aminolytica 101 = DSM 11237]
MSLNSQTAPAAERSIVLVGLMGAGKTAIGKRLAALLGLPFYDADEEIERAAGMTIAEIFKTHGEAAFRAGEKRVIQRLLSNGRIVLATGGGAFMDPETREAIRVRATSVWLRCPIPVLVQRTAGRTHRPLLNTGNPAEILEKLSAVRSPVYALADIIVDGSEDPPHVTTANVASAIETYSSPRRVEVQLSHSSYDVLIGGGLLARAGALMAPLLPQSRCFIVTDEHVAELHLHTLTASLDEVGIAHQSFVVPPGEASKSFAAWQKLIEDLLAARIDRKTTIIALGGGVVGDLAGFAAASAMRGVPFVQIPTTLLAQVDSSVGGKTGINSVHGKNLIGAFYQPLLVLADTGVLDTLSPRERAAGYAEIVKTGLISDAGFYNWCEAHGQALLQNDKDALAQAIEHAVRFKARVVGDDERETKPNDGRALLNLGHTFAHALEAETGYDGRLLHGEAVATGLVLAAHLSAALGLAPQEDPPRIAQHLSETGLPVRIQALPADKLLAHMKLDKKNRGGKLHFVLQRGIGRAFTSGDVPEDAVRATLLANGAV